MSSEHVYRIRGTLRRDLQLLGPPSGSRAGCGARSLRASWSRLYGQITGRNSAFREAGDTSQLEESRAQGGPPHTEQFQAHGGPGALAQSARRRESSTPGRRSHSVPPSAPGPIKGARFDRRQRRTIPPSAAPVATSARSPPFTRSHLMCKLSSRGKCLPEDNLHAAPLRILPPDSGSSPFPKNREVTHDIPIASAEPSVISQPRFR
jgi:hypothetical protein